MKTDERSNLDQGIWLIVVGLAGWIIPGAGHFLIHERKRAAIIFATITSLFLAGLFIGSIGIIDPVGARIWYIAQMLFSPVVGVLAKISQAGEYSCYGRPQDTGLIYTGIAGLLNLLSIISAVYMAYCGRGQLIGHEEEEEETVTNA